MCGYFRRDLHYAQFRKSGAARPGRSCRPVCDGLEYILIKFTLCMHVHNNFVGPALALGLGLGLDLCAHWTIYRDVGSTESLAPCH